MEVSSLSGWLMSASLAEIGLFLFGSMMLASLLGYVLRRAQRQRTADAELGAAPGGEILALRHRHRRLAQSKVVHHVLDVVPAHPGIDT